MKYIDELKENHESLKNDGFWIGLVYGLVFGVLIGVILL